MTWGGKGGPCLVVASSAPAVGDLGDVARDRIVRVAPAELEPDRPAGRVKGVRQRRSTASQQHVGVPCGSDQMKVTSK